MSKRSFKTLFVGALLLSSVAAAQELPTLTVGILLPQSGVFVNLGASLTNGSMLAFQKAVPEFKKLGFALKMQAYDDKGTKESGLEVGRKIGADRNVLAIVGPGLSESALTATLPLRGRDVAMVSPFAIDDELTQKGYPNFNRVVPRADMFTDAEADFVLEELKARSIAVLNDATQLGSDRSKLMIRQFSAKGAKVVEAWSINPDTEFGALAQRIVAKKPDSVHMAVSQYTVAAPMVNALRASGFDGPIFTSSVLNPEFQRLTAKNAVGLYFVSNLPSLNAFPRTKTFLEDYRQAYGKEPLPFSVLGYDAMNVVLEALKTAVEENGGKAPTRGQVEQAVRQVKLEGLSGPIGFDKNGDRVNSSIFVVQMGPDGQSRVVTSLRVNPPKN